MEEKTYSIYRYYRDCRPAELIESGLTWTEAKAHCSDPTTKGVDENGVDWFDGFGED